MVVVQAAKCRLLPIKHVIVAEVMALFQGN
jgi:hypothetical protein